MKPKYPQSTVTTASDLAAKDRRLIRRSTKASAKAFYAAFPLIGSPGKQP